MKRISVFLIALSIMGTSWCTITDIVPIETEYNRLLSLNFEQNDPLHEPKLQALETLLNDEALFLPADQEKRKELLEGLKTLRIKRPTHSVGKVPQKNHYQTALTLLKHMGVQATCGALIASAWYLAQHNKDDQEDTSLSQSALHGAMSWAATSFLFNISRLCSSSSHPLYSLMASVTSAIGGESMASAMGGKSLPSVMHLGNTGMQAAAFDVASQCYAHVTQE